MKAFYRSLIVVLAIGATACFEDPGTDIVWGEDAFLELDRAGQPNPTVNAAFLRENDGIPKEYQVQVNLMGKPRGSATSVTFEIGAASTAVEGVHFNLQSGTTVTIPAGENTAMIDLDILADNIEPGEKWDLVITLTGGDLPLSNYVTATFVLQVTCPSDLAGTYSTLASGTYAAGGALNYSNLAAEVVLTGGSGTPPVYTFDDMSFGVYDQLYGDSSPSGRITDICDEIGDLGDTDQYGDPFTITGTVNGNGTITIVWSNTYGDSGTVTLTKQ